MAQTEEVMLQNVAYRPTVDTTGDLCRENQSQLDFTIVGNKYTRNALEIW